MSKFDVILDRDGVLNMDVGYTHHLEDFAFPGGTIEGLKLLKKLGARFSIATGQSGIVRGKYGETELNAFNQQLITELKKHDITIAATAFCPHHPKISGECACRKPGTGMLDDIEEQLGEKIDWTSAWGVGDKPADSKMMLTKNGRAVLIESSPRNNTTGEVYWTKNDPELSDLFANKQNFTAANLLDAARIIEHEITSQE